MPDRVLVPVYQAARAVLALGIEGAAVQMYFFAGATIPAPLQTGPWGVRIVRELSWGMPWLMFTASAEYLATPESFAEEARTVGFQRSGTLAEVLAGR